MLNPDDLLAAWVEKFSGVFALRAALGGETSRILSYSDAFPGETNLRRAIYQLSPGSLMVVWVGFGPRRLERGLYLQHQFSMIVRAPEPSVVAPESSGSYGSIIYAMVNGIDESTGLKMLHAPIHPQCEPMDLDLPSARRQTLLVSAEGETLDYFEVSASLMEIGDN